MLFSIPELTISIKFLTIQVRKIFLTGGVMLTAKVTSKGQITIPKKIRDKMGISEGEEIQFEEKNGLFYIKKCIKKSSFEKWVGYLTKQKGRSTDDIIEELRGGS